MNLIHGLWISCLNNPLMAGAIVFGGGVVVITLYTLMHDFATRP